MLIHNLTHVFYYKTIAENLRRPVVGKWDLVTCPACQAIVWTGEAIVQETRTSLEFLAYVVSRGA